MRRPLNVDEFVEYRLRDAVVSLVKRLAKDGGAPELYDRLLAMLKELKAPKAHVVGQMLEGMAARLEEVENQVRSFQVVLGGRVKSVPAMSPNRIGVER